MIIPVIVGSYIYVARNLFYEPNFNIKIARLRNIFNNASILNTDAYVVIYFLTSTTRIFRLFGIGFSYQKSTNILRVRINVGGNSYEPNYFNGLTSEINVDIASYILDTVYDTDQVVISVYKNNLLEIMFKNNKILSTYLSTSVPNLSDVSMYSGASASGILGGLEIDIFKQPDSNQSFVQINQLLSIAVVLGVAGVLVSTLTKIL